MTTETTPVLLPDLEGEVVRTLAALEEWAADLERSGPAGLDAAGLHAALAVLHTAARTPAARLLASDGREELDPLRVVVLEPRHLAALHTALAAVRGRRTAELDVALEDAAARYADAGFGAADEVDTGAPVRALAALLAAITLDGDDAATLRRALTAASPGADLVLTGEQEAAYGELADRVVGVWWGADAGEAVLRRWAMGARRDPARTTEDQEMRRQADAESDI